MARLRGENRTYTEKQKGEAGEVAPEFQGLGSKGKTSGQRQKKLKQTVLPTSGDRKIKDRHCAVPGEARTLFAGKKKKYRHKGTVCILQF